MKQDRLNLRPVILSGGAGTRLWPTSRAALPKQLLPLVSDRTMLQETALRLTHHDEGALDPIVICNEAHRFLIASQLQTVGVTPCATVLEPEGRNTAPAAAIAALLSLSGGTDEVLLVMPADHHIEDEAAFLAAVRESHAYAAQGHLITFGINPGKPETGYGYIKSGSALPDGAMRRVESFVEKPDEVTAKQFLKNGGYYWNSGIFMFRASAFLAELAKYAPGIEPNCRNSIVGGLEETDFFRLTRDAFLKSPSVSIDYAVMEHTEKALVMPVDMGWSDVGSWSTLWDIADKDGQGNATEGDVIVEDAENCYLKSDGKLISAIGVKNLVLIETDDAILAADKSRVQDVKTVVERLKRTSRRETEHHRKVQRPWGWYDLIEAGEKFQIKIICVLPGQAISLQYHEHRSEHWIILEGQATVTLGSTEKQLAPNDAVTISAGTHHRLRNRESTVLKLVEVQSGSYLGEDDIVRLEDIYDRV